MPGDEVGSRQIGALGALIATLAFLAVGARALADEVLVAEESAAEIAARAGESASDLAATVRSVENSLSPTVPSAEGGGVLSAEENDALVEAGMKQQLAGLADELDQLSTALASNTDPATQKVLFASIDRRAAALSQLGARSSRVVIPPELVAELLALRSDVKALSGRTASDVPVESAETEGAP